MSLKTARWFAAWRSPCAHASPHRARAPARQAGEVAMTDKTRPGEHNPIARRNFLLGAGTAVAAGAAPSGAAQAQQPAAASSAAPAPEPDQFVTLTAPEAAFIVAAVDTLIPADELSPSGSECGVAGFIDRPLGSALGGGAQTDPGGPFPKGKPGQGHPPLLHPRDIFSAG